MWIKVIIISILLLVSWWDGNNVRFQALAQATETALKSVISVLLLFIAIWLISSFLEVKHVCVLGY